MSFNLNKAFSQIANYKPFMHEQQFDKQSVYSDEEKKNIVRVFIKQDTDFLSARDHMITEHDIANVSEKMLLAYQKYSDRRARSINAVFCIKPLFGIILSNMEDLFQDAKNRKASRYTKFRVINKLFKTKTDNFFTQKWTVLQQDEELKNIFEYLKIEENSNKALIFEKLFLAFGLNNEIKEKKILDPFLVANFKKIVRDNASRILFSTIANLDYFRQNSPHIDSSTASLRELREHCLGLSEKIGTLARIKIQDKDMFFIPEDMSLFTNCKALLLENCALLKLDNLDSNTSLKILNLSKNKIKEISKIACLSNLQKVFLDNNQIQTLDALENLKELNSLNLCGNKITEIAGVSNLEKLIWLYLSANQIEKINGLENLTNLKELDLSGNKIKKIENIKNLNLTQLDLSFNQIEFLDGKDICITVEELKLNNNKISQYVDLESITNLLHVYLSNNNLKK